MLTGLLRPGRLAGSVSFFLRALLKLASPRKSVAARNLEIALPDRTPRERRSVLMRTYDHLVWVGIEFIALQHDPRQVLEWVEAENASLLDVEGGAIIVACHVGNWELLAAWLAQSGHRITAIVREPDDAAERDAIGEMRRRAGVSCLSKHAPMTRAAAVLRRGELLGIMPDQHGGSDGIKAPLFGLETSTPRGPALFAYLTGKPLIPVSSYRVSPFKHKLRVWPPIEWRKSGSRDETIYGITLRINKAVEDIIREAPDQWLAQHKRFKEHY
ncbi:MAG: lysophospholipid acyltransferase family protein [Synergistaceae bacterium]|nr:lysophospholipid acyltransferase family protein [Synergistaceae bacterium]